MPTPPNDPLAELSWEQRLLVLEGLLQELPLAELHQRLLAQGVAARALPDAAAVAQVRASTAFGEAVARRRQYYERLLARQALWLLLEEAGVPEAASNEWLFNAMERLQDLLGRCDDETTAARVSDSLARLRQALLSAARWRARQADTPVHKTGRRRGPAKSAAAGDLGPLADRLATLLGLSAPADTAPTPAAKATGKSTGKPAKGEARR